MPVMRMLSATEKQRYARHFGLPDFDAATQEALKQQRVLLIGAGGIGCPAALYLTACGIGELGIVDDDTIALSNLQRQVLYQTEDCGQNKVNTAKTRLQALNPHVKISTYATRLHAENALSIVANYDLVLDGSDNFATRYLVNDICQHLGIPLLSASIFQFTGQLGLFNTPNGPCYRCAYPEPPTHVPNCTDAGVLGVVPGILSTLSVNEIIKYCLNLGESCAGKLLTFDALSAQLNTYTVARDPNCPCCAQGLSFDPDRHINHACDTTQPPAITEVSVQALADALQHDSAPRLIDVREYWEREICALTDDLHIPLGQLLQTTQLPWAKDTEITIYCHAGVRSLAACQHLMQQGFTQVSSLREGIRGWIQQIDPTMQDY